MSDILLSQRDRYSALINDALADVIHSGGAEERLCEAMRYSLLASGKRIRPTFALAFAGDAEGAMPFALAVEMLHAYSLIHDDLPCMDDDDTRRGLPTNHIAFGESTAVIAGDALQALAFETMLSATLCLRNPLVGVEAARIIAAAVGAGGMCGGQELDMQNESRDTDIERLRTTCLMKTGALFIAACEAGAILAGANTSERMAAREYGRKIGLAFQIVDDMLDASTGADEQRGKPSFYTLAGPEACRTMVAQLTDDAKRAICEHANAAFLSMLADELAARVE